MKVLELVKKYSTLSIIGMDKNVGKTTFLNHIIKEAWGSVSLGLTSIGRDGEECDKVTFTEKPRIYVEKGTIIGTAMGVLKNSDITKEILLVTKINTAMGEIVVLRALSDGYVELAGPSSINEMAKLCKIMKDYGSSLCIVDGAISRKTTAAPSITEATILCTGAALNNDMGKVIEETERFIKLLSTEKEEWDDVVEIAKEIFKTSAVGIINKDLKYKRLQVDTAIGASKDVLANLDGDTKFVAIRGILSDRFLNQIMECTSLFKNIIFLVEDGTKIFLSSEVLNMFTRQGGILRVINKINLIGVSYNASSPFDYEFNCEKFRNELLKITKLPIFDVVWGDEN